jgi:5-(hydroxymethyl)furfural/furfural oxidase
LQARGIPVVLDLQGVGRNLHDHPYLYLAAHLRRHAMQDPRLRPWVHSCLRFSSGEAGCLPGDMILTMLNKTMWHALGAAHRRRGGEPVPGAVARTCPTGRA